MAASTNARPDIVISNWKNVNSLLYPTDIPPDSYAWGVNIINRGGVIQTRPGRNRIFTIPGKKAQGFFIFWDTSGKYWQIWAVDGKIYASRFPFVTYEVLSFSFSTFADKIYFAQGIQAAQYTPTGELVEISPIRWLLVQDGVNSPGWWDPVTNQTVQKPVVPRLSGTQPIGYVPSLPIGTVMVWTDNRLWLAVGPQVFASDLLQPFSFLEGTYLSLADGFAFPFDVKSMVAAPEDTGLYVNTDQTIGQLQSQIQDRTLWQSTPQFQSTLTQELGGPAAFGVAYAHGLLWMYSNKGLISINNALQSQITSVLYTQDGEMARSRNRLSPDRSGVALGLFENLLLCAVPSSSLYNQHIWVMDGDIASLLMSQQPPVWAGIWTGTWPIQFGRLIDNGVEHIYELSYSSGSVTDPITGDTDCGIHIWEMISPNQYDSDGNSITPIQCEWESGLITMPDEQWYVLKFLEIYLVGIRGLVEFEVWIAGMAGQYNKVGATHFQANVGPFGDPNQGDSGIIHAYTSIANNYKSQLRFCRTPEDSTELRLIEDGVSIAGGLNAAGATSAHNIETDRNDYIDKAFQIALKWTGILGIRKIKAYIGLQTESVVGEQFQDETGETNVVLESVT
jgi:hypothetical protein